MRSKLICLKCIDHNASRTVSLKGMRIQPLVTECDICGGIGACISVSQVIKTQDTDNIESYKVGTDDLIKTISKNRTIVPGQLKAPEVEVEPKAAPVPIDSMKLAKEQASNRK